MQKKMISLSKKLLTVAFCFVFTCTLFSGEFTCQNAIRKLTFAQKAAAKFWTQEQVIKTNGGFHIWFDAAGNKLPEPADWGNPLAENLRLFYAISSAYNECNDPAEKARIKKMIDHGIEYFISRRAAGNGFFPNKEKFDDVRRCVRQVNAVNMIADAAIFSQDKRSADFAKSLFDEVYSKYHDNDKGGFFERLPDECPPERYKRLETQLLAALAINSLYKLFPSEDLKTKLQEMFKVITTPAMYHSSGLPYEWLKPDFSYLPGKRSSDDVHYGHAAEAGWIIYEVSQTLEIPDTEVKNILAAMAETLLRDGADKNGAARMLGSHVNGVPDGEFIPYWWNNLELMNFSLCYYKVSGDKRFLDYYFKLGNFSFKNYPLPDGFWCQHPVRAKAKLYRGGVMGKSGWHLTHAARFQKELLKACLQK